ncbi:MAG: hypothetical protein ABIH55_03180 [Nanoarchaeota archaeon]|nr:hypothetical protein [Nanoarchaeota archaeon]MBU1134977.1 hypothetical protein [Nanoarchaeota archaeon]
MKKLILSVLTILFIIGFSSSVMANDLFEIRGMELGDVWIIQERFTLRFDDDLFTRFEHKSTGEISDFFTDDNFAFAFGKTSKSKGVINHTAGVFGFGGGNLNSFGAENLLCTKSFTNFTSLTKVFNSETTFFSSSDYFFSDFGITGEFKCQEGTSTAKRFGLAVKFDVPSGNAIVRWYKGFDCTNKVVMWLFFPINEV